MELHIILVSAIVGFVTSLITAYLTSRFKINEEKEKWRREFPIKYAEMQAVDKVQAQKMAVQFAIGVLIKNPKSSEKVKIFMPPNCRLIAGTSADNEIKIDDPAIAQHHCAFDADDTHVYAEDLGSGNGVYVNGTFLHGRRRLESGDIIKLSTDTEIQFHKLDGR